MKVVIIAIYCTMFWSLTSVTVVLSGCAPNSLPSKVERERETEDPQIIARRNLQRSIDLIDVTINHYFDPETFEMRDRKSTRLNSSHVKISYAVFCLKKKK